MPDNQSHLIEVRCSRIHGSGVFACVDIAAGTCFCEYRGEIISRDEMLRRAAVHSKEDSIFVFQIDETSFLDASLVVENNPARFINHSCDENCEVIWDPQNRRMKIFALRDIRLGEEISFDYGFGLADFYEHPCRCGSKNCAHYIVAKLLRPALLKKLLRHARARRSF